MPIRKAKTVFNQTQTNTYSCGPFLQSIPCVRLKFTLVPPLKKTSCERFMDFVKVRPWVSEQGFNWTSLFHARTLGFLENVSFEKGYDNYAQRLAYLALTDFYGSNASLSSFPPLLAIKYVHVMNK